MSFLSPEQVIPLTAVLVVLATFGFHAETTRIGRKMSGALIILVLAVILSNIGLIPHSAPVYDTVGSLLVPVAIPMLLFRADLKMVLLEIGPMLKSFIASAIVIAATIISLALLFDFGDEEARVAAALTASYIGGSLNFVATAQAVELTDPNHYVAALTADTIGAVFFLALLMLLPLLSVARKAMPSRYVDEEVHHVADPDSGPDTPPFNLIGLGAALSVSLAVCALGQYLASAIDGDRYFILIITVLALLIANFARPLVARFNAEFETGTFFMYLFFATIGAGADLASIGGIALPYVVMICAAVAVFFPVMLIIGRIFRLDLAEFMISANACILGPATAAALAAGQGWKDLVTPGMLAGILGYSIGTFIGVAVAGILG